MISILPPTRTKKAPKAETIIIHGLPCKSVTPWKSDPNRYFKLDQKKFWNLVIDANANNARLFLVNYASAYAERGANQIKVYEVDSISDKGLTYRSVLCTTQGEFATWLEKLKKASFS